MKKKKLCNNELSVLVNFIDNEYGAVSYDSAFSEDLHLTIPNETVLAFIIAFLITGLSKISKEKSENLRDVQKGVRDIQRIDIGLADFGRHSAALNPYIFLGGGIYAMMLMAIRWDKEQQEQEIAENRHTAQNLQAICNGANTQELNFKIHYQNNQTINALRVMTQTAAGALTGIYMGFSAQQVASLVSQLAPSIIVNPLPFVITGLALAAVFCVKRYYDQYRLNIKKKISVLECELELNRLSCQQLCNEIALNKDAKITKNLKQQLETQQQAIQENCSQLTAARNELQSIAQRGNNLINVSQKTISTIKNTSIGIFNLVNFSTYIGLTTVKILGGASLLSILGGPVGVALMAVAVTCVVAHVAYNTYKRHQATQQEWSQAPEKQLKPLLPRVSTPELKTDHFHLFPKVSETAYQKAAASTPRLLTGIG